MSKQRSTNFSKSEEERLVALVLKKKSIFENKKTDAITSKQKDTACEKLAEEFNASSETSTIRTAKVLKEKYNNIKRAIRKSKANSRRELFLTGGGPYAYKEKEDVNPVIDQLIDAMGVSVSGLPARYDDDQFPNKTESDNPKVLSEEVSISIVDDNGDILFSDIIVDEPDTEGGTNENETLANNAESPLDWSKYHPTMLRTKKNDLLKTSKASKRKLETSANLVALKKQLLEQQFENARLEHEQRMMHAAEEHKLRMQILEAELKSKQV